MKKKLSIILAGLLLTAALAGCAGSKDETSKTEQTGASAASSASQSSDASSQGSKGASEASSNSSGASQASSGEASKASQPSRANDASSQASTAEQSEEPEEIEAQISIDPETGEQVIVIDPEASGAVVIDEPDDDDSPFLNISYNGFEIDGKGLGSTELPAYTLIKDPQELSSFISDNKSKYSLESAYVGSDDSRRTFAEYAAGFNEDYFSGHDLMMLVVACSSGGETDLGDIIIDDKGNASIEVWGSAPKSDTDKVYMCFAVSYAKGSLDGKKITVKFADLAQGEEE